MVPILIINNLNKVLIIMGLHEFGGDFFNEVFGSSCAPIEIDLSEALSTIHAFTQAQLLMGDYDFVLSS
jgi:hypothetical protein